MKRKGDEEWMRGFSSFMVDEDVVANTQIEEEAPMVGTVIARRTGDLDEPASASA
jgi:hypothetical protein